MDLVARLSNRVEFEDRKILYSWIGGTRRDWRGQGHFRALTEESEAWAHASGFHEVVVKTKNRFYDMRGTLDQLEFDVIEYEVHPGDNRESKVYLSKRLTSDVLRAHTSRARSSTQIETRRGYVASGFNRKSGSTPSGSPRKNTESRRQPGMRRSRTRDGTRINR